MLDRAVPGAVPVLWTAWVLPRGSIAAAVPVVVGEVNFAYALRGHGLLTIQSGFLILRLRSR